MNVSLGFVGGLDMGCGRKKSRIKSVFALSNWVNKIAIHWDGKVADLERNIKILVLDMLDLHLDIQLEMSWG